MLLRHTMVETVFLLVYLRLHCGSSASTVRHRWGRRLIWSTIFHRSLFTNKLHCWLSFKHSVSCAFLWNDPLWCWDSLQIHVLDGLGGGAKDWACRHGRQQKVRRLNNLPHVWPVLQKRSYPLSSLKISAPTDTQPQQTHNCSQTVMWCTYVQTSAFEEDGTIKLLSL